MSDQANLTEPPIGSVEFFELINELSGQDVDLSGIVVTDEQIIKSAFQLAGEEHYDIVPKNAGAQVSGTKQSHEDSVAHQEALCRANWNTDMGQ